MNTLQNPFRVEGVVEPPFFTDRAEEVRRVRDALLEVPRRLLVYGERRMGKTSVLHAARRAAERRGGRVVFADLSTASSPADMANRVLDSATRALGRHWRDFISGLAGRLRFRLQLVPDPITGLAIPTVEGWLRSRAESEQYDSFVSVLDALEAMAAERDSTLALILDEFQEIHRFGGESAEWRLRGAMQHHQRLSYVLAGSDTSLIRAMTGPSRAFYDMLDMMRLGPIDPAHLSRWIDERMAGAGIQAPGLGARAIEVVGPRTRDVVRLARAAFDLLREQAGLAAAGAPVAREPTEVVRRALEAVVAEEDDRMRATWSNLTPLQQNVLRAVAWGGSGLAARDTLERFGLTHGATARNTATALATRGLLVRREGSVTGFDFESPFARAWVVRHTLPDVGLLLPIDHARA
ncbi:MAG TPA: AAA family ATPase [Longimicrobiales bacterium]|nr:AAA family ATPase [Longimicrobiales bacterium]